MDQSPSSTPDPPSPSDRSDRAAGDSAPTFFADIFQTRYREVTISAIVFAIIIGFVMNAAITYAGLTIGFTIGGSAIAAVLGFGVLRGILRKGSILETNIAQTIASAVNTSNSGIIFTVPVLFLIGYELTIGDRNFWLITLAAVAGALLGTAFIIPLRKQMLDIERLRFPSPTGVASILKSPGAGPAKAVVLLAGCLIAALIYLPVGMPAIGYEASLENLDDLVERERITDDDRERTLAIAEWIETRELPADLIERGELVNELRETRTELERARAERSPDYRAIRERYEALQEEVAEAAKDTPLFADDLARRAYLVAQGERAWEDLRDRQIGWAEDVPFGYADLQWRLPREVDEEATAEARAEDPNAPEALTRRVDRASTGRPDLILDDSTINVGRWLGIPDQFELVFAIAPFALGAGYITGKAGLFVLAGGILAYFILNPFVYAMGWAPGHLHADQAPGYAFEAFNRPIGIGLLLGGALMGVLFSAPAIKEAVKSIGAAGKLKTGGDELGLKTLTVAIIAAILFLFVAANIVDQSPLNTTCPVTEDLTTPAVNTASYQGYVIAFATDDARAQWMDWSTEQKDEFLAAHNARPGWFAPLNPTVRALLIAIIGALWIWFAGIIIAQCAGMTDWSPISGLALLTVILVLLLAGTGAVIGAVLLGAALCVAITLAADMMGDMKTGYLVGSKPKRQQVTQILVVGMGPVIAMLTLILIAQANIMQYGVAFGPETETVAPQAQALEVVITGVQGGEMPYTLYGLGTLLGCLLGLGAFPGLGVLVGLSMYLPFFFIATYGIGCLINMFVRWIKGPAWAEAWGVPFCAGLIVGDAVFRLLINCVVLVRV